MKYPSIDQLRHTIRYLSDNNIQKREFRGTVKVHGTNARVTYHEDGSITFGSRNQENLKSGHQGFVDFIRDRAAYLSVSAMISRPFTVYGEWAGKGIQAGVPYPPSWFVFGVFEHRTGYWYSDTVVDCDHPLKRVDGVYNISDFGVSYMTLYLDSDRHVPFIEEIVKSVDEECPVARQLGYPGVHGEGWVFTPFDLDMEIANNPEFGFKVKGERHQTTKIKTQQRVVEGVDEFIEAVFTESRLEQGLENLELDRRNTGDFVKWVLSDIKKEDSDLLLDSDSLRVALNSIGKRAAQWFLNKVGP